MWEEGRKEEKKKEGGKKVSEKLEIGERKGRRD